MDGVTATEVIGALVSCLLAGVGFMLALLNSKVNKLEEEVKKKADVSDVVAMRTKVDEILQHVIELKVEQAEWRGREQARLSKPE